MKLDNAVILSCHPLCGMPLWSFNREQFICVANHSRQCTEVSFFKSFKYILTFNHISV